MGERFRTSGRFSPRRTRAAPAIVRPQRRPLSELRGELTKEEFHEWNDSLGFRSGIACAVFSGDRTFGMLTWDAQEVGALDTTHLKIAQLLAQDLGTMLAINRSVNPAPGRPGPG